MTLLSKLQYIINPLMILVKIEGITQKGLGFCHVRTLVHIYGSGEGSTVIYIA